MKAFRWDVMAIRPVVVMQEWEEVIRFWVHLKGKRTRFADGSYMTR